MKEIEKENDIFLSTILNPEATSSDLVSNDINASNTGFLTPEEYKQSDFIQKQFSDENGVFNEDAFNKVYLKAADKYKDLANIQSYSDIENFAKYNENDLYAPANSAKMDSGYTIRKQTNPFETSEGVRSLFEKGAQTKSIRELAQKSKIWDSKEEKWLDKTADELGLFGSIFSEPLVYAQWDEDGTHIDDITGREVAHKKGDWKLKDGHFYTETIGDREGYGKQFVAITDTLTKEDSWLNKIDFFDSDGLTKSVAGTTFKLAAEVLPYFIPGFGEIWGGINASIQLASVIPTFGKMLEGVVTGDNNSSVSKTLNTLENYWSKYSDSYTDDSTSGWDYQHMATMLGDIFGQLYQMRAMAKLSSLKYSPKEKEIAAKFDKQLKDAYVQAAAKSDSGLELSAKGFKDFFDATLTKVPEMKQLLEQQSKLSKRLSMGYMAALQSSDVFQEAIAGGYDRRTAGAAALAATLGQYGIMMGEETLGLGTWFLDKTVGYHAGANRKLMSRALRPYYDEFKKTVDDMAGVATTGEKVGKFAKGWQKASKGIKNFFTGVRDETEPFFVNAFTEGIEEVTEEAVMDATKGIFDFLSYMGMGKNSDTASFGVVDDFRNGTFIDRYLQNFVGGLAGGALFHVQQNVVEPKIASWVSGKVTPDVKASLIKEILNGNTNALLKQADALGKLDSEVSASNLVLNGDKIEISNKTNGISRGEAAANLLKNYIRYLDGIVASENLNLTDDQLFRKALRDYTVLPMMEESGIHKLIVSDYQNLVKDFVDIKSALDRKKTAASQVEKKDEEKDSEKKSEKKSTETKEFKKETKDSKPKTDPSKYDERSIAELESLLEEKRKEVNEFTSGNNHEKYLKIALGYLNPAIRGKLLNMDVQSYTKAKYNKDFIKLPETGAGLTQEALRKEHKEWMENSNVLDKYKTFVVNSLDSLESVFSPMFEDYSKSKYGDVRKNVLDKILSVNNYQLLQKFTDDNTREVLINVSEVLKKSGQKGLNIKDIFAQDPEQIKTFVTDNLSKEVLKNLATISEKTQTQVIESISNFITTQLEQNAFDDLDISQEGEIQNLVNAWASDAILTLVKDKIDFSQKSKVDEFLLKLGIFPNPAITENLQNYVINELRRNIKFKTGVIGFNTSMLLNYLKTEKVLDAEMVRALKNALYNQIVLKGADVLEMFKSFDEDIYNEELDYDEVGTIKVTQADVDFIFNKIKLGLNANQSFDVILKDALLGDDGVLTKFARDKNYLVLKNKYPNLDQKVLKSLQSLLKSPLVDLYTSVRTKTTKQNPLYNLLRNLDLKIFDGAHISVLDFLESESTYLEGLDSASEYIRVGSNQDALNEIETLLDLAQAIAFSMDDREVDYKDHPFGYNTNIKRYLEKYKNGQGADKYKTISTENIYKIWSDLELLRQKVGALKGLSDSNVEGKLKNDHDTEVAITSSILKELERQGTKLTLGGISIYPKEEDINKYKTDTEKLAFIEHYIYTKFNKLVKPDLIESQVTELFDNFGIHANSILESQLKSDGFTKDTKALTDYDLFVWLTTTLAVDSFAYYNDYKKVLQSNDYDKVPFFLQEYAQKVAYGFINDVKGVHNTVVNYLYKNAGEEIVVNKAKNIFFLDGVAGAGKTSTIAKNLYTMLADKAAVYISAPNNNQAQKLLQSIKAPEDTKLGTKQDLLKMFLTDSAMLMLAKSADNTGIENSYIEATKNYFKVTPEDSWFKPDLKNLPKYIFIDEVTHFNYAELQVLDYIADKYGIKLITFGDTYQNGAIIKLNGSREIPSNIQDLFTWKTPKLKASIRPTSNLKKESIDNLVRSCERYNQLVVESGGYGITASNKFNNYLQGNATIIPYFEDDQTIYGDKFVSEITVDDLKKLKNSFDQRKQKSPEAKVGVLTEIDSERNPINSGIVLLNKLHSAGFTDADLTFYSPENAHNFAVQGAEEEFFVMDPLDFKSGVSHLGENYTKLYTYITRSLTSSAGVIKAMPTMLAEMRIFNEKRNRVLPYLTPETDKRDGLKQEKIKFIEELLKNYKPAEVEPKTKKKSTSSESSEEKKLEIPEETPEIVPEPEILPEEDTTLDIIETEDQYDEVTFIPQEILNRDENSKDVKPLSVYKPDSIWGYGFYNHLGVEKGPGGYFKSGDGSTSLDLDGLIWEKSQYSEYLIQGFLRLKGLIANYNNNNELGFKNAIDKDDSIADLFLMINPQISSAEASIQRREEAKKWIKKYVKFESQSYAFAVKTDPNKDLAFGVENNKLPDTSEASKTLLLFGKRIYSVENGDEKPGCLNQYISCGALADPNTLKTHGISNDAYEALCAKMIDPTNSDRFRAFKLSESDTITALYGIQLKRVLDSEGNPDFNHFTSLYQLERLGFNVDKNSIYLIKRDKINGEYAILDYIAREESNGDEILRKKKLNALKKSFVNEKGDLIISGKYFTIIRYAGANNETLKRIIILDPQSRSMQQAVAFLVDLQPKKRGAKVDFSSKLSQLSAFGQNQLIVELLKQVSEKTNTSFNEVSRKYLEKVIDRMENKAHDSLDSQLLKMIIKFNTELTSENLSEYLQHGATINGEIFHPLSRAGIYFCDEFIKRGKDDTFSVKNIISESREAIEIDFTPFKKVYFNIHPNAEETITSGKNNNTQQYQFLKLIPKASGENKYLDLYRLGIYGHYVQAPIYAISSQLMSEVTEVESKLNRVRPNYENFQKPFEYHESWSEQQKKFNPKEVVPEIPDYIIDSNFSTAQHHVINSMKIQVQASDWVYLFGNKSDKYYVSEINPSKRIVTLTKKNGSSMKRTFVPINYVSGVATRYITSEQDKLKDYYYKINQEQNTKVISAQDFNPEQDLDFNTYCYILYSDFGFAENGLSDNIKREMSSGHDITLYTSNVEPIKSINDQLKNDHQGQLALWAIKRDLFSKSEIEHNLISGSRGQSLIQSAPTILVNGADLSRKKSISSQDLRKYIIEQFQTTKADFILVHSNDVNEIPSVTQNFYIINENEYAKLYPKPKFYGDDFKNLKYNPKKPKFKEDLDNGKNVILNAFTEKDHVLIKGSPMTITAISEIDGVPVYLYTSSQGQSSKQDGTPFYLTVEQVDTLLGSKYELITDTGLEVIQTGEDNQSSNQDEQKVAENDKNAKLEENLKRLYDKYGQDAVNEFLFLTKLPKEQCTNNRMNRFKKLLEDQKQFNENIFAVYYLTVVTDLLDKNVDYTDVLELLNCLSENALNTDGFVELSDIPYDQIFEIHVDQRYDGSFVATVEVIDESYFDSELLNDFLSKCN